MSPSFALDSRAVLVESGKKPERQLDVGAFCQRGDILLLAVLLLGLVDAVRAAPAAVNRLGKLGKRDDALLVAVVIFEHGDKQDLLTASRLALLINEMLLEAPSGVLLALPDIGAPEQGAVDLGRVECAEMDGRQSI